MQCKTTNCNNKTGNIIKIDDIGNIVVVRQLNTCVTCDIKIISLVNKLAKFSLGG